MGKTKIRTTIDPTSVIAVEDNELLDLQRQGLVRENVTEAEAAAKAKKSDDKKGE